MNASCVQQILAPAVGGQRQVLLAQLAESRARGAVGARHAAEVLRDRGSLMLNGANSEGPSGAVEAAAGAEPWYTGGTFCGLSSQDPIKNNAPTSSNATACFRKGLFCGESCAGGLSGWLWNSGVVSPSSTSDSLPTIVTISAS